MSIEAMCCLSWHPLWALIGRRAGVKPGVVWSVFSALRADDEVLGRLTTNDQVQTLAISLGWKPAEVALVLASLQHSGVIGEDNRLAGEWAKQPAADVMPDVMPSGITRPAPAARDRDTQRMALWRTRMGLPTAAWLLLRAAVFERDAHSCCKCGAQDRLHCDHIIELADGGETTVGNLQTLCQSCHSRKTRRTQTARVAPARADVMPAADAMPPPSKEEEQDSLIFPSDVREQARDPLGGGYGTQAEAAKQARAQKWLANTLIGAQERLSRDRFAKLYAAAYVEPRPRWAQLELDRISMLIKQNGQPQGPPQTRQAWMHLPIDGGYQPSGVTEEERLRRYRERARSA